VLVRAVRDPRQALVSTGGARGMSDLTLRGPGDLQPFDPTKTREVLARLDGDIVTLRQLQDWPKLAEAADAKMKEQAAIAGNNAWRRA
jgi:hypothetical protein